MHEYRAEIERLPFFFSHHSFFPNVLQPIINVLLKPMHVCCLRVGLIRPHSAHSSTAPLTSVHVSVGGGGGGGVGVGAAADPLNMERRRQIALKALTERLAKTSGSSNQLPKSLPQTGKHFAKHHQHGPHHPHHSHHHHHHNSDGLSDEATMKLLQSFAMPAAIALPAPPPPVQQQEQSIVPPTDVLIDVSSAAPVAIESNNLIESSTLPGP